MSIFFKTYSHHYHTQTLKRMNYTVHTFPAIPYSPIPTSSAQRPQHGQRGYPCSLWDQSILITIFRPKTCPRKQMRHRSTPLSTQTPGKCEDEVISTGEVTRLRQQTPNIQRFFFTQVRYDSAWRSWPMVLQTSGWGCIRISVQSPDKYSLITQLPPS